MPLQIKALLTSVNPALPWVALTLGIFLFVYATRRFVPQLWVLFDKVTPNGALGHVVQGLPSVLLGALWTVLANGGDFKEAWLGALMGAFAPVLHLLMKNYTGASSVLTAVAAAQKLAKTGLVLLLLTTGCAGRFEEAKMAGMQERASQARPGVQAAAAADVTSDYCRGLDSGHRTWAGIGKFEMVASGGLAASATVIDSNAARIGVLVGAAVLAAGGAGAIVISDADAASWARDCQ